MLYEVEGDLLDFAPKYYIGQQCNTTGYVAKGLSAVIFKQYPEANVYKKGTIRIPGTADIIGRVVNLYGQVKAGKPSSNGDSKDDRVVYFIRSLDDFYNKARAIQPKGKILLALPKGVGCGLAGGDWNVYQKVIEEFDNSHPNDLVVLIVQKH